MEIRSQNSARKQFQNANLLRNKINFEKQSLKKRHFGTKFENEVLCPINIFLNTGVVFKFSTSYFRLARCYKLKGSQAHHPAFFNPLFLTPSHITLKLDSPTTI